MILTSWIKADILTSFRKSYYLFLIYLDLLSISLCKNKTIFLLPNFWGSKSVWNANNHQQVTQWSSGNFGARDSISTYAIDRKFYLIKNDVLFLIMMMVMCVFQCEWLTVKKYLLSRKHFCQVLILGQYWHMSAKGNI